MKLKEGLSKLAKAVVLLSTVIQLQTGKALADTFADDTKSDTTEMTQEPRVTDAAVAQKKTGPSLFKDMRRPYPTFGVSSGYVPYSTNPLFENGKDMGEDELDTQLFSYMQTPNSLGSSGARIDYLSTKFGNGVVGIWPRITTGALWSADSLIENTFSSFDYARALAEFELYMQPSRGTKAFLTPQAGAKYTEDDGAKLDLGAKLGLAHRATLIPGALAWAIATSGSYSTISADLRAEIVLEYDRARNPWELKFDGFLHQERDENHNYNKASGELICYTRNKEDRLDGRYISLEAGRRGIDDTVLEELLLNFKGFVIPGTKHTTADLSLGVMRYLHESSYTEKMAIDATKLGFELKAAINF